MGLIPFFPPTTQTPGTLTSGKPFMFHQFGVYNGNVYDCATGATAGSPNAGSPLATYLANVFPGLVLTGPLAPVPNNCAGYIDYCTLIEITIEEPWMRPTMIFALGLASLLGSADGCGAGQSNADEAKAIAQIQKNGGVVVVDEKRPRKPAVEASVTGPVLPYVKELDSLQSLELCGPGITDAGLKYIEGLSKLERLWLYKTKVTDARLGASRGSHGPQIPLRGRGLW